MPARAKTARPRRVYKQEVKAARRYNRVQRVVNQPVRAQARRDMGNEFLRGVGRIAAPIASQALGALATRGMSIIRGQGDYDISGINHNSLVGKMSPHVPQFSSGSDGSVVITHREYITDILSTTDFNLLSFPINPSLPASFPWLSRIAQNYEQYSFDGLIFEFKSGSSDALNSTNTALGYVVLATEYNSLAPDYTNKLQMENAIFACSTKPSLSVIHAIECAPAQSPLNILYTRTGFENIGASDLRFYDLGRFNIATIGMQAIGANIGELWCSYKVVLKKTTFLEPGLTIPTYSLQFQDVNGARGLLGQAVSQNVKINTLGITTTQTFVITGGLINAVFTFPPGRAGNYLFNYHLTGELSTALQSTQFFTSNPFNSLVNITERNIYSSNEAKTGLLADSRPYNSNITAGQTPDDVSAMLTYSFTIVNNNLPASFTFSTNQGALASLVRNTSVAPFTLGECYITLVNSQL